MMDLLEPGPKTLATIMFFNQKPEAIHMCLLAILSLPCNTWPHAINVFQGFEFFNNALYSDRRFTSRKQWARRDLWIYIYIYIYIGEEGEGKGERERNEEGERRERKASLYFCSAILYSIPASLRCGKHGCDHYYAGLYQNTIICPYTELPGDGS